MRNVAALWIVASFAVGTVPSAAYAQEATPAPVSEPRDEPRLRIGFDVVGGWGVGGGTSGSVVGGSVHGGLQIDRRLAIYLQGTIFYWASAEKKSASGRGVSEGALGAQLTPLFSFTPIDAIEIAAGPSCDALIPASTSVPEEQTTNTGGDSGTHDIFYPGMHGVVALLVQGRPRGDDGRRTSYKLQAIVHPTIAKGDVIMLVTGGLGIDWY